MMSWVRPLVRPAFDDAHAVLRVSTPNRFKLDWVRKNFSHQIETLASEWYKRPVQVAFELASSTGVSRVAPVVSLPLAPGGSSGAAATVQAAGTNVASAPQASAAAAVVELAHDRSRLNTDLTFDNFVTGKANQLARAADRKSTRLNSSH